MLNSHSQIALGMERYRNAASSGKLFEQGYRLFEEDKFFDWQPDETSVRIVEGKYAKMYEQVRQKYSTVTYRGDKVPSYFAAAKPLFRTFPGAKMVIIWRKMDAVAMSWQRRSEDKSAWPAKNDAMAALKKARRMFTQVEAAKSNFPGAVMLVQYEKIFQYEDPTALRIIEWLGLDPHDTAFLESVNKMRQAAEQLTVKRGPVSEHVTRAIAKDYHLQSLTARLHGLTQGSE